MTFYLSYCWNHFACIVALKYRIQSRETHSIGSNWTWIAINLRWSSNWGNGFFFLLSHTHFFFIIFYYFIYGYCSFLSFIRFFFVAFFYRTTFFFCGSRHIGTPSIRKALMFGKIQLNTRTVTEMKWNEMEYIIRYILYTYFSLAVYASFDPPSLRYIFTTTYVYAKHFVVVAILRILPNIAFIPKIWEKSFTGFFHVISFPRVVLYIL